MWPFESETVDTEALELYEEAVEELRNEPDGPANEREWADLGRQLNRLASLRAPADAARAVEAFEEAAEIWRRLGRDKARMVSQMRLSVALARAERPDEGLELIESLVDRAMANPVYRLYFDSIALHRAGIHYVLGNEERAVEDLERVIAVRSERKPGSEAPVVTWRDAIRR